MKFEILHRGKVIDTREFQEGNYKIGRTKDCEIFLKSPQVSKQHALLVIKGDRAAIVDLGSANGVFVNGVMVKKHRIRSKDEVVIADFRVRIAQPKRATSPPPAMGMGAMGGGNLAEKFDDLPGEAFGAAPQMAQEYEEPPETISPQEKLLVMMDEKVLGPFYDLAKAFDWRVLLAGVLGICLSATVGFSVYSLLDWGQSIATDEALKRAHTVISQTVRENYRVLTQSNDFTRLTVKAAEEEHGVLRAMIIDPTTKTLLAPTTQLRSPVKDVHDLLALERIIKRNEDLVSIHRSGKFYTVAQPLFTYSQQKNSRNLVGIVLARFEVPDGVYATYDRILLAVLFGALFALVGFFFLSKMISFPILRMQEQLDNVLKGEGDSVNCETKFPELENLATVINFSVSRWKQSEASASQNISGDDSESEKEAYLATVAELDAGTSDGLLLLDRDKKIQFVGNVIEELLQINNNYARGQNVTDACKDGAVAGTFVDITDRVLGSFGENQHADMEINGIFRSVVALPHKGSSGDIHFILIVVKMNNES